MSPRTTRSPGSADFNPLILKVSKKTDEFIFLKQSQQHFEDAFFVREDSVASRTSELGGRCSAVSRDALCAVDYRRSSPSAASYWENIAPETTFPTSRSDPVLDIPQLSGVTHSETRAGRQWSDIPLTYQPRRSSPYESGFSSPNHQSPTMSHRFSMDIRDILSPEDGFSGAANPYAVAPEYWDPNVGIAPQQVHTKAPSPPVPDYFDTEDMFASPPKTAHDDGDPSGVASLYLKTYEESKYEYDENGYVQSSHGLEDYEVDDFEEPVSQDSQDAEYQPRASPKSTRRSRSSQKPKTSKAKTTSSKTQSAPSSKGRKERKKLPATSTSQSRSKHASSPKTIRPKPTPSNLPPKRSRSPASEGKRRSSHRQRSTAQTHQEYDEITRRQEDDERSARDKYLVEKKKAGWSYKEIKRIGGFSEAESTLRGRYRSLTKEKEERVRVPLWTTKDFQLLDKGVRKVCKSQDPRRVKVPWTKVSEYITDHGGSYKFAAAACHTQWKNLMAERKERKAADEDEDGEDEE